MRIRRNDRRAGEVVAVLVNINRDTKKSPEPVTWLDVFPEHREKPEPQTDEQMLMAMQLWSMATAHLKRPS